MLLKQGLVLVNGIKQSLLESGLCHQLMKLSTIVTLCVSQSSKSTNFSFMHLIKSLAVLVTFSVLYTQYTQHNQVFF